MPSNNFAARLSILIENDSSAISSNMLDEVNSQLNELNELKSKIKSLEKDLSHFVDKFCAQLAVQVRRLEPSLDIHLYDGSCAFGYKSMILELKPNIEKKVWMPVSPDSRINKKFVASHGANLRFSNDLSDLAEAIVHYFKMRYKSLMEDVGVVTINNVRTTIDKISNRIVMFENINGMGMAADVQPSEVLQKLGSATSSVMVNTTAGPMSLMDALKFNNIKSGLSKDKQSIHFYIKDTDGQRRPILTFQLSDVTDTNKFLNVLEQIRDIATNSAPGTGKMRREKLRNQEQELRKIADKFSPVQDDELGV